MEKIMTIYDEDQLYCKRLGFYLRENTKLPFQIYPLTTPDALLQFQKKKEADLLLLSEKNAKTLPFSPKRKRTTVQRRREKVRFINTSPPTVLCEKFY